MIRSGRGMFVIALLAVALGAPSAAAQSRSVLPDPNFAVEVLPRPCALDTKDPFEAKFYELEGWAAPDYERYPGACQRLRFSYGPIVVKPGQNDVLVGPVTIEKPSRDGFITRFKPNLVTEDGNVPPVEKVHLHHGTWLSVPEYGSGPFFAAGEEKTIAPFPKGYGMPVKRTDTWLLLYMVHSAVSQPMTTFITYDIDFVPKDKGEALGIKPAYPLWLDVRPSGYPVFNVQREFGGADDVCTWPKEQCAAFDPWGEKVVGQGRPGNGKGEDYVMPKAGERWGAVEKFTGGTLIGIGGHLHPGGLTNDIDLVRPGGDSVRVRSAYRKRVRVRGKRRTKVVKRYRWRTKKVDAVRIYTGKARYWSREDKTRWGGPPTSWDFSMEVMGFPKWGVRLKPGDRLRSNATYDTKIQASYENMGISVALLAPDGPDGKPSAKGVDVFDADWRAKDGPWDSSAKCGPENGTLCRKGLVTHGHYRENGNYGGPEGDWTATRGPQTKEVGIANFLYEPGDLSTKGSFGIPTVKLGTDLRFTNLEGEGIYHTITTCKFPCLGQTGAAFPLADGQTSKGRSLDLDSAELGIGAPAVGAAKNRLDWSVPVKAEAGFQPGETVTYYCRVHPFMRGAFEVTE